MASTDRDTLVALFNATNGANWTDNTNWNTNEPLGQWCGVNEVNEAGCVVKLDLSSNNLHGHIPPQLGDLGALKHIFLANNKLNGPIPPELGKLTALETLNLNYNQLIGSIPKELGDLTELQQLWLFNNQLSGPIPAELGKLTALEWLDLNDNHLSGPIPPELGMLTSLKMLLLQVNQLTGNIPPQLGQLGALEFLNLANNKLDGNIPPQLGQLGALKYLDLGNNNLDGPIPPELGNLSALQYLVLKGNRLSGPIPPELGNLRALKRLVIALNTLSGPIPEELGKLTALIVLQLGSNNLSVFPRALAERCAAQDVQVITRENPWTEPPADVLGLGMAYAARFLKDLDDFGRTSSNRLKVVLVGLGNAGKTSVAVRLEGRASSKLPTAEERTVGVEIRDIRLGAGPANEGSRGNAELDVKLWDFAGQRGYYDTHQMFLTPGALFVLVVDMFAYSADGHSREDALEQWLDILQARVPGSVVLLVGTHSDSFDSSEECDERVGCFLQDKEDVMKRIRRECKLARERARQDSARNGARQHAGVQDSRRYQPPRVVVVDKLLALNLSPSGVTTAELREHIERVAYGVHDGYSFPSVNSEVPEPHLLAVATLEAVRRGATLRGSGGDPAEVARRLNPRESLGYDFEIDSDFASGSDLDDEGQPELGEVQPEPDEGQPFILFPEALSRFLEVTGEKSMFGGNATEGKRVFLEAIKLHEAQGAILLTRVDGGAEKEDMEPASAEHFVIHVNPAWFADLVRRIVDIRLLDPAQQEKVAELIKRQPPASIGDLSKQHRRFFLAGEVSKRYMKFLWKDRDLELGPASPSPAAPPLEMSNEAIATMVESLLDVRFMFRVRHEEDHYIVPSCLPDHVGCAVDPKKLMDLKVGGAIFSRRLELVGAHSVPPGLIPRLLAWCGKGDARITACWKRGVCFAFNRKHLVLLFEHREAGRSVIECHAMGSAHDERAGGTLEDVVAELGRLVGDAKYGFPGVGLFFDGEVKKQNASSAGELEDLLTHFAGELKDHMNVKFEELGRKLDEIAAGVEKHLRKGQEEMATSFSDQIQQLGQDVSRKVDCIAAVTSECLLVSVEKDIPCPRLIIISEEVTPGSAFSSISHFRRDMMDKLLRREGGGPAPQRYRIGFLCAHDLTAATCGEDGLGYKVEIKGWQNWLRACLPVIKVSLWLLRVGISVVTRADILPVQGVIETLEEVAGEEAAGILGEIDLQGQRPSGQDLVDKVNGQAQVFGTAYAELAKWVQGKENEISAASGEILEPKISATGQVVGGTRTAGNAVGGGAEDGGRCCGWRCSWWHRSRGNAPAPTGTGGGTASGNVTGGVPAAPVATASTVAPGRSFEGEMVLACRQRGTEAPEWAWVRRVNKDKWQKFQSPRPATTAVPP